MSTCHLYDITEPNPESLAQDIWINVKELMNRPSWFGEKGGRIGFISTITHKNLLAGLFANEGRKRGIQYTDDKRPIDAEHFYSFEHLFFAIFMDTSQLILQHRNLYGFEKLNMGEMRDNFSGITSGLAETGTRRCRG